MLIHTIAAISSPEIPLMRSRNRPIKRIDAPPRSRTLMRKSFATSLLHFRQKLSSRLACFVFLALLAASAVTARADERAVKSRVSPVYPELAKRMKISGTVSVQVTVDAEGKVTDAKATNGNRLLAGAAEDAVRKWKFAPGDGVSVVNVEINFQMQ
jgi:TonB family protein